jgi:DNA-binding NarL/FixJ family response regulator
MAGARVGPRHERPPVSVFVIDDDPAYRAAVAEAVDASADLSTAGVAGSIIDGLREVEQVHPDVVVIDVRMPDGGGVRAARELRVLAPVCKVLAVSVHADPATIEKVLGAGAHRFLAKGGPIEELLAAIRALGPSPDA